MRLDGQFTVTAAQADIYAFLTDPATVSRHMPDVKNVVIEETDHFTVTARVGISHIKGDVTISGRLAAFGPQGLIDRIARKNIDTFVEGIRSGLQSSGEGVSP